MGLSIKLVWCQFSQNKIQTRIIPRIATWLGLEDMAGSKGMMGWTPVYMLDITQTPRTQSGKEATRSRGTVSFSENFKHRRIGQRLATSIKLTESVSEEPIRGSILRFGGNLPAVLDVSSWSTESYFRNDFPGTVGDHSWTRLVIFKVYDPDLTILYWLGALNRERCV
jgi:hypothetical protein